NSSVRNLEMAASASVGISVVVHYAEHENEVACGAALLGLNSDVKVVPVNRTIILKRNSTTGSKEELMSQLTDTCSSLPVNGRVVLVGSYWSTEKEMEQIALLYKHITFLLIQGENISVELGALKNVE